MRKVMLKRTCYGCKALDYKKQTSECLLNYSIKIKSDGSRLPEPIPTGNCPKPRTHEALFKLLGGYN